MNQVALIGLIVLIGFLLVLFLVVYQTDQKIKEYLKEHPELDPSQPKTEGPYFKAFSASFLI